MADSLVVTLTDEDGMVVVSPKGEIGFQEAPSFKTYFRQAFDKKPRRLIADLSGVSYMSTPGLATLVEALQISKKQSTPLVLCGLNERVRAIFEIARLQTVFTIVANLDAARK
jgi:anti-sigma B factor antagonist